MSAVIGFKGRWHMSGMRLNTNAFILDTARDHRFHPGEIGVGTDGT